MKTKFLWSLAVLNAALLAMLVYRGTADNAAHAQAAARQRTTVTDCIMIPGQLPSGNNSIIYLIDVGNHQLSALAYNGQGVDFLSPPVDLDRLFERTGNVGNGGAGTGVAPGATGTRGGTRMR